MKIGADRRTWVVLGAAALGLVYFLTQPVATYQGGIFLDAESYAGLAAQAGQGEPLSGLKPFVYRLALPWLVGHLTPDDLLTGFQVANLLFGLLSLAVLVYLLDLLFEETWLVALLGVLFVANPNSPFRFNAFYPVMTDPALLFFSALVLYLDGRHPSYSGRLTLALCLLSFTGVLFRESVLLAPLSTGLAYFLVGARGRWRADQVAYRLAPVVAGIVGLSLVRLLVVPEGGYTAWGQVRHMVRVHLESPLIVPLVPLATYGPALLLALVFLDRRLLRFCRRYPVLPVYGAGVLVLTFVGGYHGVRLAFWGHVAFLPLLGVVLAGLPHRYGAPALLSLLVPLAIAQGLAFNVFGQIPDIASLTAPAVPELYVLFPFGAGAHYDHLAPHAMVEGLRGLMLLQYAAIGACLLIFRLVAPRAREDSLA